MTVLAEGDADDKLVVDEPLTTKEGWRRFVEHQADTPAAPSPANLLALAPSSTRSAATTTRSCR